MKLLRLYLQQYLNVLGHSEFVGDVYLYDLFCSEGIYENGGKGSSIVMLETIQELTALGGTLFGKKTSFHCLFNDIRPDKVDKLKRLIVERGLDSCVTGTLRFESKDYSQILPEITDEIQKLRNGKAFVFIDPYGYKNIRVSDIRNLLQTGKAEVLLFLPTQFMFRFERKGTPESLTAFISELVPEEQWPSSATGLDFIATLKEKFKTALGQEFFVDSFIISRELNQFFCLFFFASHIYGFDRMLHAKWKIDEEDGRGWKLPVEHNLFSNTERSADTIQLERMLKIFLKDWRTNGDIYASTLHAGFLPTHAVAILEKLQNEGSLLCECSDGSKARKSAFYVSFKNWKENKDKLRIKLK